ncbi:MAG: oligosaccharide flippase family protein, partial [Patescibacteria group bacterium]
SDIGLAASLIQKKEIHDDDIKTTFTVQQILIISIIVIGFFATSFITSFYQLPQDGVYLYWSLLIGFFISSLKTIPSIFLERDIKFEKIVFVQVVENTVFYFAVSIMAVLGFGLQSFTVAVLLRSIVGLILIYSISFWKPQIGISRKSLGQLLSFGLPFQASSFLALFKDDLIILYLGKVIGFEALGYIGWAKKWSDAPIRIIMDNVNKVLFPLMARFQDDKEKISKLCERLLHYQSAILVPIYTGMIFVMPLFVELVPRYQKWQPALPLFTLFAISSIILSFGAPFMNLLNALGHVKQSFSFMMLFTIIMWIATPVLTQQNGLYGFPFAHLLVSTTFILVIIKAQKMFHFSFIKPVLPSIISSVIMGVGLYLSPAEFVSRVIIGIVLYSLSMILLFKINPMKEIAFFTKPSHEQ